MNDPEAYVSIDIETDGQAPGVHSMLALGAAVYASDGTELSTFYRTIRPIAGTVPLKKTMDWWKEQPEAWAEVTRNQVDAHVAIPDFARWCDRIFTEGYRPVPAAWPAAFDFSFVNYYLWRFCGRNPLGFSCMDIRSYADGMFGLAGYFDTRKVVPDGDLYQFLGVKTDDLRPHVAVDDARRQGRLLMAMMDRVRRMNG